MDNERIVNLVPVPNEDLIALIKAKVERDLILRLFVNHDCHGYKVEDLLTTLARINGVLQEETDAQ